MPKISPLPPEEWSDEQADLLQPMRRNEGVGEVAQNLFTTLVRHPKLFKRWSVFANHILFKSTLPPRERELVILRVAWLCHAGYEWGQHVLIARDCGISDDTIRRVKIGPDDDGWTRTEAALLRAVDELQSDCRIADGTWSELQPHYSEQQMLDLMFTAGNYRLLAGVMRSIDLERDAGVCGLDGP